MKKKTKRKVLYALSTLLSALSSPGAYAKIPLTAFKGVTNCFQDGKKFFSPTLGEVALDSGLIYNLRFYGNFTTRKSTEGVRQYDQDEPQDHLCKLVKILFPSSGGQLSTDSTHPMAFGPLINTPEAVSFLFNFINKMRSGEDLDKEGLKEELLRFIDVKAIITINAKEIDESYKNKKKHEEEVEKIFNEISHNDNTNGTRDKELSKEFKNRLKTYCTNNGADLQRICQDIEFLDKTGKEKRQEEIEELKKRIDGLIGTIYDQKIEKIKGYFKKRFANQTLDPLLQAIKDVQTSEENSTYPKYTTEQIILAFFCHKFNAQEDIWQLMKDLDRSIVERNEVEKRLKSLENGENLTLKEDDLDIIVTHDKYDLDDILALEIADTLTEMSTPYPGGSTLISNGKALPYSRTKGDFCGTDFADCGETALRHFLNIMLYNPKEKAWDLTSIEKTNSQNPYFANLKTFYEKQTPVFANNGGNQMRGLFNTVVGDLNQSWGSSTSDIRYARIDNNELQPGFINFMHVFQRLFGLDLDPLPQDLKKKREWLEISFQKLCETLNPTKSFRLDISTLEEKNGELTGDLPITVLDKKTLGKLAFFTFHVEADKHADIILPSMKTRNEHYTRVLMKKNNNNIEIGMETAEESIWLLSADLELREKKITQPLYHLFNKPLMDNNSRIYFLKKLHEKFPDLEKREWSKEDKDKNMTRLKGMLKNILADISWEDENILQKVSTIVFELYEIEELRDIIVDSVLGSCFNIKNSLIFPAISERFPNIQHLFMNVCGYDFLEKNSFAMFKQLKSINLGLYERDRLEDKEKNIEFENIPTLEILNLIYANNDLEILSLKELPNLKSIRRSDVMDRTANMKKINLENLTSLETLDLLVRIENLEELSLKNLPKLRSIPSIYSAKKINLSLLTNLETLNLPFAHRLEELFLKDLPNLRSLYLNKSPIKNINLEDFPNLEILNLEEVNLEEFSLKNLPKLKSIDLPWSTTKIELDLLSNLETLNYLKYYIKEFSLKNLPKIKSIDLEDSLVTKIHLEALTSLETLNLERSAGELRELSIKDLPSLKSIYLKGNPIEKIDLDALGNLRTLNLRGKKTLENLSLKNLTTLVSLDLNYSSVQHLVLNNLANLSMLDLTWCQNLKKISFEGDFSALKSVRFNEERGNNIEIHWKGCALGQEFAFSGVLPETTAGIITGMKELDEGTCDLHAR